MAASNGQGIGVRYQKEGDIFCGSPMDGMRHHLSFCDKLNISLNPPVQED